MVRYTGINHLAFATSDMDATVRFWRDLLGLRLVVTLGGKGYRQYFFELSENDLIAFFEWPDVRPIEEKDAGRPVKGPFGFDHVSLGVENADQLWELKDRLNAAGIFVTEVLDQGFIHSVFSFDPNGIAIEISHNVPDIDIRSHPAMVDPNPKATAIEGSDPVPGQWPSLAEPTPMHERKVYPGEVKLALGKKKPK